MLLVQHSVTALTTGLPEDSVLTMDYTCTIASYNSKGMQILNRKKKTYSASEIATYCKRKTGEIIMKSLRLSNYSNAGYAKRTTM